MSKFYIGCHLSIAKGFEEAAKNAVSIGANTFQFFTRNPRGGAAKAMDQQDLSAYHAIAREHEFGPILAHAPYTMNLASDKEEVRTFALSILQDDYDRVKQIENARYLFHPGSHVGLGVERGTEYIIKALNTVLTGPNGPWVLLEGMTGKGSEIGSSFEELKDIIQGVHHSERLGICIDTCHLHAAGYDIVTELEDVFDHLNRVVGLDKIKGVHVNDNMNPFESHKDRHATLGEGSIGLEAIVRFIQHPALTGLPFNLETPNELEGYQKEIQILRSKLEVLP